ncbi:tyrosine-type recombinase/integrase [Croceimicrobium sp.]|uniref:tyrosine-type recombinase/integrase n=1 Tax=Croceimicrobium sp. TaxID=2828340 RepID=UPI003BA9FCB6
MAGTVKRTFSAAKLYDADGDPSKKWFVYYSFLHPDTGRMKRFKIYGGLNYEKDKKKRRRIGREMVEETNRLLHSGFDPFKGKCETIGLTVRDNVDQYIRLHRNSWRKGTILSKSSILSIFCRFLDRTSRGNITIDKVSNSIIVEYLDEELSKGCSDVTYNTKLIAIKGLFTWAIKKNLAQFNPCDGLYCRRVVSSTRGRIISKSELKKVKNIAISENPRFWNFILVIYYCFIRPKEILSLKISDFDLQNQVITVRSEESKNKRTQSVSIPNFLVDRFQYLKNYPSEYFVFGLGFAPAQNRQGKNNPSRLWKSLVKEQLSIPSDLYSVKHRGAVDALNDGLDIRALQRQLRHSSLDQTEVYLSDLTGYSLSKFQNRTEEF